ncbi:hypothetical protein D5018_05620 [Parashewanella curva]|uniref:RING-type domain-containing protein n=1 Tax=Parashewanella curva TaxID=2338552 RepID=A0A3L8Q2Q0_9GAMM|nr:RING finger protein [Parashewanella curva]RLV60752.1 hypothetical protein D5018_05620 [Parashewanella curva]
MSVSDVQKATTTTTTTTTTTEAVAASSESTLSSPKIFVNEAEGTKWSYTLELDQLEECCICMEALAEKFFCNSGHRTCQPCYDRVKASEYSACPICRDEKLFSFSESVFGKNLENITFTCTTCGVPYSYLDDKESLQMHRDFCFSLVADEDMEGYKEAVAMKQSKNKFPSCSIQ